MVQTRSMSKTLKRRSARKSYARRVSKSICRGITRKSCYRKKKCRFAKGKTRNFCRKAKNTKRRMRGGNTSHMSNKGSAITHTPVH